MLEREQFDLLHFHEPFVPFLSPIILRALDEREHRDVPRLRRLLAVVRVRQQGDEGRGGPAPRPDRRQRRGEALHRPLLPGRVQGHPERRRRRRASSAPSRSPAGRTARSNLLFVGRFEPRKGLLELLKAYRILRKTGCDCRLLVVGHRAARHGGAALRRDAPAAGRRVPRPGQRRGEGPALPDGRRLRLAGDRRRVVRDRPARGDGRRARRSSRRDIHGYKGVVRRGREGLLVPPREPKAIAGGDRPPPRATTSCGRRWARRAGERAEEFSWERVTAKVDDYYGFVIRRLAARGELPAGFHAADPAVAPAPRQRRPPATMRSASGAGRAGSLDAPTRRRRSDSGQSPARLAGAARRPPRARGVALVGLPLGERQPPDPRRVADDERTGTRSTPPSRSGTGPNSWIGDGRPRRCSPGTGTGRGRSAARPGRRWRSPSAAAAPNVRVDDDEPADDRDDGADDEPPGVAGGRDERGDQRRPGWPRTIATGSTGIRSRLISGTSAMTTRTQAGRGRSPRRRSAPSGDRAASRRRRAVVGLGRRSPSGRAGRTGGRRRAPRRRRRPPARASGSSGGTGG